MRSLLAAVCRPIQELYFPFYLIMNTRTFVGVAAAVFICGLASAPAATVTFSNTNSIVINDSESPPTAATPYPSTIEVTNLSGEIITKVTVSLFGFAHTFPSDVDIVLVGPEGQNAIVLSNVGGQTTKTPVTNIDLVLDDDAESYLPTEAALTSGTFKPTQGFTHPFLFDFPPPAPKTADLMGPFLSNFNNTEPNGTWSLYVVDDSGGDSGVITGGWSLTLTTAPVLLSITQQQTNAIVSWTNTATGYTLQSTAALSPAAWTNVNIVPSLVGGYYTVTNPMAVNSAFYRLTK
jgi:subtilisin-like proprotein convertase family protein